MVERLFVGHAPQPSQHPADSISKHHTSTTCNAAHISFATRGSRRRMPARLDFAGR